MSSAVYTNVPYSEPDRKPSPASRLLRRLFTLTLWKTETKSIKILLIDIEMRNKKVKKLKMCAKRQVHNITVGSKNVLAI